MFYLNKMQLIKKLILFTYPFRMKIAKLTGMGISIQENKNKIKAPKSFYSLEAASNTGETIPFEKYKGQKVLIVNLASQCGYTPQYAELETLHKEKKLIILGFPSNNFGKQEPGDDAEIASFCSLNYGVTFPLFKKDNVKGNSKQPVYAWLADKNKNGWNDLEPQWNFYKYLIDEEGNLSEIYSSSVSPTTIPV
jgi:glutathione peroxidase